MGITEEVERTIERVRLELVTRRLMIMVLAVTAVWVGIAIMVMGAPDFLETWFSPWSRYAIGGCIFLSGLTTSIGGVVGEDHLRGWWIQVIGLGGVASWFALMGLVYAILTIKQGGTVVGPGEYLSLGVTGRGYVPVLYLGLTVLTAIPLVTMLRLGRPSARPAPLASSSRSASGST